MKKLLLVTLSLVLLSAPALARKSSNQKSPANLNVELQVKGNVSDNENYRAEAAAAQGTTFLAYYTFDNLPFCIDDGWTSHDLTAQTGDYFHVDDFGTCGPGTFGRLYAIEGSQSLWCGACRDPGSDVLCRYAVLPGYGNDWDQAFCTRNCVFVDSFATLDYFVMWDSEANYDATTVEYNLCDDPHDRWVAFAGGLGVYDGTGGPIFVSDAIPVAMDSMRIRFHFDADPVWSDEDGLWDTDGAIIIDSLTIRCAGSGIVVPTELFEDESVGANDATDWESCTPPGFGDLAQLIRAIPTTYQNDPVQEDPCVTNFTCLWNFYRGSTIYYIYNQPNPSPQQQVIPYVNNRNQYIHNEIWSPWIPLVGSGAIVNLEFDVYRDLALDGLVFYIWHVRSIDLNGANCPSYWVDRGYVYYGGGKDWYRAVFSFGDLIMPGATHIRIAMGVIDMCQYWCGITGDMHLHSHAPLFDNVEVYRVQVSGPQFSVGDIDMFQDNFSADGTITGTARADMAQNILSYSSPGILPGDSVCVTLDDPEVGTGGDLFTGCGPAAYCYISVDPTGQTGKTALDIQAPETRGGCGLRWPYVTSTDAAGRTWYVYRMDSCYSADNELVTDRYCIDFNDNLFTPGDTCWFFFGAQNNIGTWTYFSLPYELTSSLDLAAANPDEFTILPAVGDEPGCDILYVDGMNYRGAQPFFDTAFENMNILDKIDRYDIRGPSSGVDNRPGSRVVNVFNQLVGVYNKIIWNTGDLSRGCIGDGVGYEKSDDATMLFNWIDQMPNTGGIYFSGDDLAEEFATLYGSGAVALRGYCSYTVTKPDHVDYGVGVNPTVKGVFGGIFSHGGFVDSLTAYGGCPLINDFDVLSPAGTAVLEASYHGHGSAGGAIVSQTTTNTAGYGVKIILSGFSFHYIRDIDSDGIVDRYHHMYDIITALDNTIDEPIAVRPDAHRNSLAQNYPNPFNPTTTIEYTIKERAHVSLRIYNVAGQLVRTLVDEVQKPDELTPVLWNGANNAGQAVSSGVYFYKLVTKNFTQTKKLVLLK